ncbi:hypothetical protein PCANC_18539 [Puccinia coronata f. sp. avenae]|uniref:Uncharacterized protein n=1 Tax=Puccinia coronata f. sp. avenae TaxID=200324 RepID=A0A2N5SB00_9BASI|nr:hypothetical protein PCANC_18539 [Puccinia coronata f. sp. avenae]
MFNPTEGGLQLHGATLDVKDPRIDIREVSSAPPPPPPLPSLPLLCHPGLRILSFMPCWLSSPLRCAKSSGPARCATAFSAEEKAGNRYFQRSYTVGSNGVILVLQKAQRFWQPLHCAEGSGSARCATAFLAKEKAGSRYFQR